MNKALTLLILAFSGALSSAQIVFEEKVIEHTATVDESNFAAVFKFQNVGDDTIEIKKPSSSCGCTVPSLEKTTYAPGEEGEITAVFSYGTRSGTQHKTVTVPTSKGTHELALTVDIPLRYSLDVRLLHWKKSEVMAPKTANFQFHVDLPVELIGHTVNEAHYNLDLKISPESGIVTATIRPTANAPAKINRTDWEFKTASGKIYKIPLYIRVY